MMKRFELAYDKAVEQSKDTFTFDGHLFFTPYAKYLLEHLKKQIVNTNDN